ncbi:hypothetical protein CORC01_05511 [Colletotrichum orchidophilum]|uniref:SnoaL-like domain-containing protein n=1 Tax=Colletotrichum orchidophilum TaxID=1209926 RepID=A0A1G4BCY3_9PEZI|nr:uncharacterized protein CORC01_05511 [Colletotrichum orchidophilum]OHE99230.1 hypothetical protein CORC01_05511 [Colletotrichum orchidophilum]
MVLSPEAAETIRRKKTRYCRYLDTKQWASLSTIILPDAEIEFLDAEGQTAVDENGVEQKWNSLEGFVGYFEPVFAGMQTLHVVDPGDFEVDEENGAGNVDETKAVFGFVYHAGNAGSEKGVHLTGGGHYYETWRRDKDGDGEWYLAKMRLHRLFWKVANI